MEQSAIRYAQSLELPYSPDQMFDLVADIERYPEFLPEYREARIRSRRGDILLVDQVIGLPLINLNVPAEAMLNRPDAIIVRSDGSLLGELEIRWDFERHVAGTHVGFRMAMTPSSRLARIFHQTGPE